MRLAKKSFAGLITLMTLALGGLIVLQIALLEQALSFKRQSFQRSVSALLNTIVQKVQTHEISIRMHAIARHDSMTGMPQQFDHILIANGGDTLRAAFRDSLRRSGVLQTQWVSPGVGNAVATWVLDDTSAAGGQPRSRFEYRVRYGSPALKSSSAATPHSAGNAAPPDSLAAQPAADRARRAQIVLITKVLDDLERAPDQPLSSRITPARLDSIISATLHENGFNQPYAYGIYAAGADSFLMARPAALQNALRRSSFRTPLFPFDLYFSGYDLVLFFPEQDRRIFWESGTLFLSILVLLLIVCIGFIYTVKTLFSQSRFARALTDFINNMTHEFKTPISTISLATEAILHSDEAAENRRRRDRYLHIIADENLRMRQQVEKILQMAVLERGEYELNLTSVDLHTVISSAIENIALQIENRRGKIISRLQADRHTIRADALHMANMIHNLLDNACKYTTGAPRIAISTRNTVGGVEIAIEDNGIGLRPEQQRRVFEKYYRVSTGNVHDIKGFGLGLSYVKLIAEAHGGRVHVRSKLRHGSTFTVFLPLNGQAE